MSTNTNPPKKPPKNPATKLQRYFATVLARREYKSVGNKFGFLELPFICRPRHGSKKGSNWRVPKIDDYGQACDIGREYAAHFAQYLKDNPDMCGANSLGHIAKDIDFKSESDVKGYWVGFFSHLERLLFAQVQRMDVFADIDRINAHYAKLHARRWRITENSVNKPSN